MSLREWLGVDRGSIALAFTDIVRSTDLALEMGDRAWIDVLIEHFKKARQHIEAHGGYEVKLIGDACMVAFRTACDALEFATSFSADTGHPNVSIRAGINVGEVRILEDDAHGLMVNYTSRVQHAIKHAGIAVSSEAKQRIVYELGASISSRFLITPLKLEEPLQGFSEDQQLWEFTPLKVESVEYEWFDEYGSLEFSDESARLDNFALQLQNKNVKGSIKTGAPVHSQATNRSTRAREYLIQERGIDPTKLTVQDGLAPVEMTELYIELRQKERSQRPLQSQVLKASYNAGRYDHKVTDGETMLFRVVRLQLENVSPRNVEGIKVKAESFNGFNQIPLRIQHDEQSQKQAGFSLSPGEKVMVDVVEREASSSKVRLCQTLSTPMITDESVFKIKVVITSDNQPKQQKTLRIFQVDSALLRCEPLKT